MRTYAKDVWLLDEQKDIDFLWVTVVFEDDAASNNSSTMSCEVKVSLDKNTELTLSEISEYAKEKAKTFLAKCAREG